MQIVVSDLNLLNFQYTVANKLTFVKDNPLLTDRKHNVTPRGFPFVPIG